MLKAELVQVREAHAAREREIQGLTSERDWLRRFIVQFLGTIRDSMDSAHAELESRPGGSDSRPFNYANEAESEYSQRKQLEPTGKTHLIQSKLRIRYEDALRETFVAFRLREMAKDRWLRASEAQALKNQP
ncbi:hypothetical protein M9H77_04673 [Catharanthus roseus]|uniref:Uncharacterized protein n=1 Tax=Catharanthus roseus TaxID=4058 RepID=A0ACC0CEX7_CATRO|nr:hypothetical protein M9H77_04673 [Catharanthus roseus]